MKSAAKVGVLLVVFVALLFGSYAMLGKSLFTRPVDRYFSDMADAGGITEGTPILMAGVDIGKVGHIALVSPRLARLTLEIKHNTPIPAGSEVVISQSLIGLGQAPLAIVPPERETAMRIAVGETIPGRKASPLDSLLPNSKETVHELTQTMAAVRKLLEDQKLKYHVETLMASTQLTIDKFGKLAADVSTTLKANQGGIAKAISTATNALQDVRKMTLQVASLMNSGKYQRGADQIIARVELIEKHTDALVENLNRLVNDPSLRTPAKEIAANVVQITSTGKSIASHADAITKNGEEISKNGIEISKNVAVVSQKAIALTDKANELATNAVDIEHQFKGVLDKVGGFFDHTPTTKGFKLGSEVDLMRQSDPGYWRTDITFDTPIPDGTLYAGIYDAFESNRFTVEIGRPFGTGAQYRYGIYASKPGFGVDYPLAKRLSVRADAWDINNPRLDMRARYDFGNGLTGWVGVDSILHNNAPTIGIGIVR
jgi:phospholipid/cholesterol/gamma-HCH transport system substrate-binding protein